MYVFAHRASKVSTLEQSRIGGEACGSIFLSPS